MAHEESKNSPLSQNIKRFYSKILPNAFCSVDWTEEKVTNAFSWAKFCEMVCKQGISEESFKSINDIVHSVSGNCIENLDHSSIALYQAFLHNPSVNKELIESQINSSTLNSSLVAEEAFEIDGLCNKLVDSLKDISIVSSDRSFYYEVKAELYLDSLLSVIQHQGLSSENESFLSLSFSKLLEKEDTMNILLYILIMDVPNHKKLSSEVQEFCRNFSLLELLKQSNCGFARFYWQQSPGSLRNFLTKCPPFFSYHLNCLTKFATSFSHEVVDSVIHWKNRDPTGISLSFDEVCNHFKALLTGKDSVHDIVCDQLTTMRNEKQSKYSVWNSIYASCF